METILPLFFVLLFGTFMIALANSLYAMFKMARRAEQDAKVNATRKGRSRAPSASDNLAFRRDSDRRH